MNENPTATNAERLADHAGVPQLGVDAPIRELHMRWTDRVGDTIFRSLARLGLGPASVLTTRGRRTGRLRSTPVVPVQRGDRQWLVAPYGEVSWVRNARAANQVDLRHGRHSRTYTIRPVTAAEAGPILKQYVAVASATRPYFRADRSAPVSEFVAEAHLHPVFELIASDVGADKGGVTPGSGRSALLVDRCDAECGHMTNEAKRAGVGRLGPARYVSLTTFKRDGTPVACPVWVVSDDGVRLLVSTGAETWKVKRLRRNPRVVVAEASASGKLRGEQIEAQGRLLDATAGELVTKLIREKYGVWVPIIEAFYWFGRQFKRQPRPQPAYIEIVDA